MILSKSNNFLFLKAKKTAGINIEIFLSRYCDDGDVISPITPIGAERLLTDKWNKKDGGDHYRIV